MSYGERVKQIRKKFHLTQNELAKQIELKNKQTISDIENGKQQRLSAPNEILFCTKFQVDIFWLQSGEIDTTLKYEEDMENVKEGQIDYGIKIPLSYYPDIYTQEHKGSHLGLTDAKPIAFSKKFLELHLGLTSYADVFIIDNSGEGMQPTFKRDALLFVNPLKNEEGIRDGSIYMIMCEGSILVKRVLHNPIEKTYTLVSDNPNPSHKDIILKEVEESACEFVGRIVASFDKI